MSGSGDGEATTLQRDDIIPDNLLDFSNDVVLNGVVQLR